MKTPQKICSRISEQQKTAFSIRDKT